MIELLMVKSILAWAVLATGLAAPSGPLLPIHVVPQESIPNDRCNGAANCRIDGIYVGGPHPFILLSEDLALESNVCAQSTVAHELVHWLQDVNGMGVNLPDAIMHRVRENQAYDLQQRYLNEHGARQWSSRNLPLVVEEARDCVNLYPERQ